MKGARELLVLALAFVVAGECRLASKQRREILNLRAQGGDREALESQLALSRRQEWTLQDRLRHVQPAAEAPGAVADAAAPWTPPAFNFNARFRAALEKPEFRTNLAVLQRANLNRLYHSLFKALQLPPDKLERFKGLIVDQQLAKTDTLYAANDQAAGQSVTPGETDKAISAAQTDANDQIRSLLGDAKFEQFQEFQQARFLHLAVDQLQLSLSYTPTPLTEDQSARLVQALFNATPADQRPAPDGFLAQVGGGFVDSASLYLGKPISDQGIMAAEGVVSAPQLETLKQLQQAQAVAAKLNQLYRAAHPTAGP